MSTLNKCHIFDSFNNISLIYLFKCIDSSYRTYDVHLKTIKLNISFGVALKFSMVRILIQVSPR